MTERKKLSVNIDGIEKLISGGTVKSMHFRWNKSLYIALGSCKSMPTTTCYLNIRFSYLKSYLKFMFELNSHLFSYLGF